MMTMPAVMAVNRQFGATPPISGYRVWFDASQIGGLSNNDPVTQWDDLSGNALHMEQLIAGRQPLYKTNVLNGLPGVQFDGIDDSLARTSGGVILFPTGYQHTVFAVIAAVPIPSVTPGFIFDTQLAADVSRRFGRMYDQAGVYKITFSRDGVGGVDSILNFTAGEDILYAVKTDGASSLFRLNRDGGRQNTFTTSSDTTASMGPFGVGTNMNATDSWVAMTLCEFISYPSALGTTDFSDTEDYLGAKWGIP